MVKRDGTLYSKNGTEKVKPSKKESMDGKEENFNGSVLAQTNPGAQNSTASLQVV